MGPRGPQYILGFQLCSHLGERCPRRGPRPADVCCALTGKHSADGLGAIWGLHCSAQRVATSSEGNQRICV